MEMKIFFGTGFGSSIGSDEAGKVKKQLFVLKVIPVLISFNYYMDMGVLPQTKTLV